MKGARLSTNYLYPSNLYFDIFGGIEYRKYLNNRNNLELVRDVMLTINAHPWKVDNKLKAFSILEYRYRDKMTFDEIGKLFNVSGSRVESILLTTLRICRKEDGEVVNGLPGNKTKEQFENKLMLDRLLEKFKQIKCIVDTEIETEVDTKIEADWKIPIEELNLSVRTYNCLKRARINTLVELMKLDDMNLLKIRNFGKKSLKEIISIRKLYCIK